MGKDWTYEILKYLYENYEPNTKYMNDFLIEAFNLDAKSLEHANLCNKEMNLIKERGFISSGRFGLGETREERDNVSPIGQQYGQRLPGDLEHAGISAFLLPEGREYISKILKQEAQNKLFKDQSDSVISTNESVRETNESIKNLYDNTLPQTFIAQNRFGNWSLILTGLSITFIGITAYLQWKDQTPTEVRALKQQVQQSLQSLDSIALYHKKIDSSMKNLNDSLVKYLKK